MDGRISTDARIVVLIAAALDGTLTEEQAEQLAAVDRDLIKLAFLVAARRVAELQAKLGGPSRIDPASARFIHQPLRLIIIGPSRCVNHEDGGFGG